MPARALAGAGARAWGAIAFAMAFPAFGIALLGGAVGLYLLELAGAPDEAVRAKMASFGVDTLPRYLALAAFYSVVHAAAEECAHRCPALAGARG